MLFDKILGNSAIINDNWKKEINKWLVFIKNKGELKRFIPRLTKLDNSKRDEALAEISSAYLLENELNFVVTGWEGELSKKELMGGRKDQPKYKHLEWRSFAHWKNIRYAIKKAYPKFLSNCKNLLTIQDDLFVSILDFPTKRLLILHYMKKLDNIIMKRVILQIVIMKMLEESCLSILIQQTARNIKVSFSLIEIQKSHLLFQAFNA